jgi:hypothetical protein
LGGANVHKLSLTAIVAACMLLTPLASVRSQQRPTQKTSIGGIVVRIGTNEPIVGARATLSAADSDGANSLVAVTDAGGKFTFANLNPGSYRLEAVGKGYVRQEYGQTTYNGQGTAVILHPGEVLSNLAIRLTPSGSVEGRVTDFSGSPVERVPVEILRSTYTDRGERILERVDSIRTDDRGAYRLFSLTPGRYFVHADPTQGFVGASTGPNSVPEEYQPAYYPGVTDFSQASAITVGPGEQVSAIDFIVGLQRRFRVRGRVIDAGGRPFPLSANISITYLSPTGQGGTVFSNPAETYNSATGTFELRDIPPGAYVVGAAAPETSAGSPRGAIALEATVFAPITVSDSDVENVVLTLTPAVSMPGKLRLDGRALSAAPELAPVQVRLDASINGAVIQNLPAAVPQFQWATSDGGFLLSKLSAGEYRVSVTGLPPDYYVKEVRTGPTDVFNNPLHFSGDASIPLDVLLSPNGGRIDGTLVNDKQEPVCGVVAVLIPDRQRDHADLYKTAITDETGHFTIRGIPPGDYKVFAWEALEEFAYYDPELIRSYEQKGTHVRITESSKESLEVKVIGAVGR